MRGDTQSSKWRGRHVRKQAVATPNTNTSVSEPMAHTQPLHQSPRRRTGWENLAVEAEISLVPVSGEGGRRRERSIRTETDLSSMMRARWRRPPPYVYPFLVCLLLVSLLTWLRSKVTL